MKWFAYIFSFYLLLLAALPCQDNVEHTAISLTTAISTAQNTAAPISEEQESHHEDYCSPLCVCFCCSVQVASLSFIALPPAFPLQADNYQAVFNTSLSHIPHAIWQPPQLG